jgi:glycosyltransferase involved in cell wall biosynthesis
MANLGGLFLRFKRHFASHNSRQILTDYEDVKQSDLFHADWYNQRYPDVRVAGVDALQHYMTHGWRESRNPNGLFDTDWYLETYPDVRSAKLNPLLHYIRHGAFEKRDTSLRFRPSVFQDHHTSTGVYHLAAANAYLSQIEQSLKHKDFAVLAPARVLLIAELSIPQCRRYRVDQKSELLKLQGYASTILNWHDADECESALATHSIVIFYRVPAAPSIIRCIEKAKALRLPTFWEVDDLIFDPNAYMANSSLKVLTPEIQRSVLSGIPSYRTALLACDAAIASTGVLAKAMREAGMERVYILENALDAETLAAAKRAVATIRKTDDAVRIVYGSGTNTHDKDFLEAAQAIRACLDTYPQVKLRIIGDLGLPDDFVRFGKRIERFPSTSYKLYLQLMAACDIAVAPLEATLFNDAKSNIKYIEAAMVGLPSVCSPRAEFFGIIEHGRNGMLAKDTQAWFNSLQSLILSRSLRTDMAALSKATVLARYDPHVVAETQLAPIIREHESPRKPLRILAVNVFFEPRSFGGATIVAEQMSHLLNARADTEVVVFTTSPGGTAKPYEVLKYSAGSIPVFAICVPETHDPALNFETPHTVHKFREVLQLTNPDVVHFHSIQGLGALLLEDCQRAGVPVVVTLHDAWWICGRQFMIKGDDSYCFQKRIDLNVCSACVPDAGLNIYRQYRLRDMLDRADLLLTPSSFFQDIYAANGFAPERLKVNRNGVARPIGFQRSPAKKLRFGYVGGNSAVKGARLIQSVFAELDRSDYELVVIDNLLSLGFSSIKAEDWPLKGELKILPSYSQSEMDSFYSQIDVLLFPTQWKESFGLTVREALIRDIWVITTDAGGVVEDVVDGENGDVIPLLDDGTALKMAVENKLDRADEILHHRNSYKANITDHQQQADELHCFLSSASRRKVASEFAHDSRVDISLLNDPESATGAEVSIT